jgi:hypothetical protein
VFKHSGYETLEQAVPTKADGKVHIQLVQKKAELEPPAPRTGSTSTTSKPPRSTTSKDSKPTKPASKPGSGTKPASGSGSGETFKPDFEL